MDIKAIWIRGAQNRAAATTAAKYGIKSKEVKDVLRLAKEYLHTQVGLIDMSKNLFTQSTSIQTPGLSGFYYVPKILVFQSMLKHGMISKKQFESLFTKYSFNRRQLDYFNNRIKNYEEYLKNGYDPKGDYANRRNREENGTNSKGEA